MAANRKHGAAGLGPVLKACVVCVLVGGSGIGYVWQRDQIDELGAQMQTREQRLEQLINENEQRRKQLARMRSPAELEIQIRKLNLGLGPPQPGQVLRLPEPCLEPPPARDTAEYQYAAGRPGGSASR